MKTLLIALALASLSAAAPQQDEIAPRRIVYVLAGQSNIEYLAFRNPTGCSTGGPRANVQYYAALGPFGATQTTLFRLSPPSNVATTPLMELGDRLGQFHAQDLVDVVMIARSGSSLLLRNQVAPFESWIDLANPSNPTVLMNRMLPVMQALVGADELHLVWGQGETDCISNQAQPIRTAEYWTWAQALFAWLSLQSSHTSYAVHLVTPGAILQSADPTTIPWHQTDQDANQLRDAYFLMDRFPLAIAGVSFTIGSVAHHYDLPHDVLPSGDIDPYHLSDCAYVTLASRIADGILAPAALPEVSDAGLSVLPNGTEVEIKTTAALNTVTLGTSLENYFEVFVNAAPVTNFLVGATGTTITIRVPAGGLTATTPIVVRHVPGSGFNDNWTAGPLSAAVGGAPLEPFVLTQ